MPNRLAHEQSPYLLQHKDNPVDWHPWGAEAFEKAKTEDKPVFLSIGYSTCHWCHVMAHESFEDDEVARLMNETFVSIKVDREERPALDDLYMGVCQLMTGQGGWPLNVVLTPDKKPFHAMTYAPKIGRFGQIGMLELIPRIRQLWADEREKVERSAGRITGALREAAERPPGGGEVGEAVLEGAYEALAGRFDAAHGGFGGAPKFPSPHNLLFLLRYWKRTGAAHALEMVKETLDAMRRGGVFDQVGYGFHRYSTDARWLVPHFEKMLYDQAMHAWAYTEAYQATGEERFRRTAEETFEYVLRDLCSEEGAFFSAEDADSPGGEGAFYVWTTDEVRDALDDESAALVIDVFNLEEEGNFSEEATGRKTGTNILHANASLSEIAAARGMEEIALRERLDAAREKLLTRRGNRERPGLDDKVLTDWNGLMIGALAQAGSAFDAPEYTDAAARAADFLLKTMRDERLLHRYRNGEAALRAHLDDYAFLTFGCLELYEATFEVRWLRAALDLTDELLAHFRDTERGGFYRTADDAEALLVRQKSFYDGALPSGNALVLSNLLRLARLTGRTELEACAAQLVQAAAAQVRQQPAGFTALLSGVDFALGPAHEVVIVGSEDADDTHAMLHTLRSTYLPHTVMLFRPAHENAPEIARVAPFVDDHQTKEGRATAYVCEHFTCRAPTTDPNEMLAALRERPRTADSGRGGY